MRFLIPLFDCFELLNFKKLHGNAKYSIDDGVDKIIVNSNEGQTMFFDLIDCSNLIKVKIKNDEYFFIYENQNQISLIREIKCFNNNVLIGTGNLITISINDNVLVQENVKVEYSHYEIINNFCVIYFKCKRNFVAILEKEKLLYAGYYDEFNRNGNELFFMKKCFDSLNHGMVKHINEKTYEEYLVYLDDYEMNLKLEFVANVFLDCVLCGNFKYANNLLCEELKQKDENKIKQFFPDLDNVVFVEENVCVVMKKNTLAGVYEFKILNNKIENIIQIY